MYYNIFEIPRNCMRIHNKYIANHVCTHVCNSVFATDIAGRGSSNDSHDSQMTDQSESVSNVNK